MLWRKADFLKGLDRTCEFPDGFSRRRSQLCNLDQQRTQGKDKKNVRSGVAFGSMDAGDVVVSSSSSLTRILRALRFPPKEDMAQAIILQRQLNPSTATAYGSAMFIKRRSLLRHESPRLIKMVVPKATSHLYLHVT
jgi:hypothetical protein